MRGPGFFRTLDKNGPMKYPCLHMFFVLGLSSFFLMVAPLPMAAGLSAQSERAPTTIAIASVHTGESFVKEIQKPDLGGVEITTHPVSGNIYMLEASGDVAGNIAVSVGPDGILIVDDQWAELTGAITDAVKAFGGGSLRFIINTHHHDDHSDGNANLVREQRRAR